MTARKQYPKGQHPYGRAYRRARAVLLESNPRCHWCPEPATTADHEPPLEEVGPHMNLVPACAKCNYGRRLRTKTEPRVTYPGPSRAW